MTWSESWSYRGWTMCRSIKPLFNFEPPATTEEISAAARQYVRKVSGYREPSRVNAAVFENAVGEIAAATHRLMEGLETRSPKRDREVEAAKARTRASTRFASG